MEMVLKYMCWVIVGLWTWSANVCLASRTMAEGIFLGTCQRMKSSRGKLPVLQLVFNHSWDELRSFHSGFFSNHDVASRVNYNRILLLLLATTCSAVDEHILSARHQAAQPRAPTDCQPYLCCICEYIQYIGRTYRRSLYHLHHISLGRHLNQCEHRRIRGVSNFCHCLLLLGSIEAVHTSEYSIQRSSSLAE